MRLILRLLVAIAFIPSAMAAEPGIDLAGPLQSYNGSSEIDGFAFSATANVDVSALGIFAGPGLTLPAGNFNVGLWRSDGTLLASATVTAADTAIDSFYYHDISPVPLTAGGSYVVAAQMGGGLLTYFGGAYTMADGLQYGGSRWVSSGSLIMPGNYDGTGSDPGYLGANLLIGPAVTLATSSNPSVTGQPVAFTATVSGISATGTVDFLDGASTLCSAVALSGGSAVCNSSTLGVGAHSITASYSGDANNTASTSAPLIQTVDQAVTTTSVNAVGPIPFGDTVTVTATVAVNAPGAGTPTGTIDVSDGAAHCTITLPANTCILEPTSAGPNTIAAI
jgi:hypothetical protein